MHRQHVASDALFERIKHSIAGGESSYARLAEGPGFCMARGEGSHIFDVDGNEYIDWCIGYGPLIMGHRHPRVIAAVVEQLEKRGSMYTFPHELDAEVGEKMVRAVPGLELVRFAMSGTEATLAAMRLARAYTGKQKILKFEGHYHGWADEHFVSYHPDDETGGDEAEPKVLLTAGCPQAIADTLVIASWHRPEYVEAAIRKHKHELAAVLCEPQMCNCGIVPVEPEWLHWLRRITAENDILLIFDEVMTGFRLALGGAQGYYGVTPDISCFSKALGAGFSVAAFGGSREVMALEAANEVVHGGTYTAMPMNLAASNVVLGEMIEHEETFFPRLHEVGNRVVRGLQRAADENGVRAKVLGLGPLWQIIFLRDGAPDDPIIDNSRTMLAVVDTERFGIFQSEMLDRGIYFHPGAFERWFASSAHTDDDIETTIVAAHEAMAVVAKAAPVPAV